MDSVSAVRPTDRWPRVFTSFSLLTGMAVAIAAIQFNFDRAPTIIAAQAVTVVGSPLVAIVLVWLASDKKWMGRPLKWFSYLGIALLVSMALRTAFVTLPAKLESYSNAAIKPAPVVKNADSNE